VNKPEQVKIEITTRTVTHTVVSGKWHIYTSTESKRVPSLKCLEKEKSGLR